MRSIRWLFAFALVVPGLAGQAQAPQLSQEEVRVFKIFATRVQQYIKLQKNVEATLPALKPTNEPARIAEHQHALARKIAQARRGARQGDIFTDEVTRQLCSLPVDEQRLDDALAATRREIPRDPGLARPGA